MNETLEVKLEEMILKRIDKPTIILIKTQRNITAAEIVRFRDEIKRLEPLLKEIPIIVLSKDMEFINSNQMRHIWRQVLRATWMYLRYIYNQRKIQVVNSLKGFYSYCKIEFSKL